MALNKATLAVGDRHEETLVSNLTRTQLVMYAGASGDYNPLHSDDLYTREAAGYPGVFAHGMLTMGMGGRLLTSLFGAAAVKRYGVRFTNQVWPGDDLVATVEVVGIDGEGATRQAELQLGIRNQKGETVIAGTATVSLA